MRGYRLRTLAVSICLCLGVLCVSTLRNSYADPAASRIETAALATTTSTVPTFGHVFEIVMENKEYSGIIGNGSAPYINTLAQQYGIATNFYAIRHPSLP